ncbi:hypothetical protein DMC30DRAFT_35559 [Rhodotorula diobovata]|uniref:Uncharacterized protein n=1 Tax=Rhodotorula diobovata TaxID=5288 RepID=A0A5C5FS80_9BASI|nr:hypothetical protein DMC30DRAFT_35559 [Rhodotorula diobovata]
MPFTRSHNTSGRPLAVDKNGVALRRPARAAASSSVETRSGAPHPFSRSPGVEDAPNTPSTSIFKGVGGRRKSPKAKTHRQSPSPARRGPLIVASNARSLTSSRDATPVALSAALAAGGPPATSPFVKRMPLFIQRRVQTQPALRLGRTLPLARQLVHPGEVLSRAMPLDPNPDGSTADGAHTLGREARGPAKRARSSSDSLVATVAPNAAEASARFAGQLYVVLRCILASPLSALTNISLAQERSRQATLPHLGLSGAEALLASPAQAEGALCHQRLTLG